MVELGFDLAVLLISAVLVIVRTANGLILSWDSNAYVSAALEMQRLGALPRDFVAYPPLFPLTLSLFGNVIDGARLLNIACFVLTVTLTLMLLRGRAGWRLQIAVLIALLVSPALFQTQILLLSEALFIVWVSAFFLMALRLHSRVGVIALAALAAFGALTRYVGIMLVPVGMWIVLSRRRKLGEVILFAVIACAPLAIWSAKNVALGFAPLGARDPAQITMATSFLATAATLLEWVPILIVAMIVAWGQKVDLPSRWLIGAWLYVALHIAIIAISPGLTHVDKPDERLLAPAFVPLVLALLATESRLRERLKAPALRQAPA